jgi:hypothetical protein
MRDNGTDAAHPRCLPVGFGVVALIGHCRAGPDVRSDIEQGFELAAIAGFAAGQVEIERVAFEIGLEVDFGREPAARPAKGFAILPPFAPAAET